MRQTFSRRSNVGVSAAAYLRSKGGRVAAVPYYVHDRDVNAAKNILATVLSAQPLVEGSRAAHGR
jgi:hypothetical protein